MIKRLLLLLLTASFLVIPAKAAQDGDPDKLGFLSCLPSAPLMLLINESDDQLAAMLRDADNSEELSELVFLLTNQEAASAEMELLKLFRQLILPGAREKLDSQQVTAVCALVRPAESFVVTPRVVLLLSSRDNPNLNPALLLNFNPAIKLARPNGESLANKPDVPRPVVYCKEIGNYTILSNDKILLETFGENHNPETYSGDFKLIRTALKNTPGKFQGYCNGEMSSLLSMTDWYIPDDWMDELEECKAISLGLVPGENDRSPHALYVSIQATPDSAGLLNQLQRFSLLGEIYSSSLAPAQNQPSSSTCKLSINTDLKTSFPALVAWFRGHWPKETVATLEGFDLLANMTGIHITRDFINSMTGRIRLLSSQNGNDYYLWTAFELS
ncbi:MAG: hypothetical protein JXA52_00245, partial [Planctomycetes bacterium]|nr:hypothetical protein [Planctomycetota bacterium]